MGYDFAKSMLLKAVTLDDHLPDAFTKLVFSNNPVVDLEAMKLHLFKEAALRDGKDGFLKNGGVTNIKKAITVNLSEIYHDASSEALEDINVYAVNRTATNQEARMPDELFRAMKPRERADWTRILESLRLVLVKLHTSGKRRTQEQHWSRPGARKLMILLQSKL